MGPFERLVEVQQLAERVFDELMTDEPFKIYINPTRDEIGQIAPSMSHPARGIVEGPNIFIWPEGSAFHTYVAEALKLTLDIPIYVSLDKDREPVFSVSRYTLEDSVIKSLAKAEKILQSHPQVLRLGARLRRAAA